MQPVIAWFVQRPLLVNLIMALVFAIGWLSIADMRYEYNPLVELGQVNITTVLSGAGPEEVELSITLPLEEELLEVEGIDKLYSNSMESLSVISLELDLEGFAREDILRRLQNAVTRAEARLPAELVEKPLLEELSTLTTPVMEVHVTGPVSEALLRSVARQTVAGLREVDGVASVEKLGYRRPEIKILLQPERLARLGISHQEIISAIRARNLRGSGGAVDSFATEKKIVASGQFRDPLDVEEVIIRAREPGNSVLLRDVATVLEGYEDWEIQSRVDGRMSIALNVRKQAQADELHTAANVREFVNRQVLPSGVELVMVGDISRLTVNMLEVLAGNALLGLAAVFLLLCYFLQLRMALWVAVGIPFAVCLCFLLLDWTGNTINASSLCGIILMMGILVDDAVVVSENTQRLRGEGLAPGEASILGASQMARPVIFSAITTMLAFAPLLVLSGSYGDWMRPFPVAVILLLLASLLESQLLLPSHLAHISSRGQAPQRRAFEILRERYRNLILRCLRYRYSTLVVFVLTFAAVMSLGALTIRYSIFPDIDIDTVHIKVELPPGTRFEETVALVQRLEREARDYVDPRDLMHITSQVGHHDTNFYGATEGRSQAWALIAVQLVPINDRRGDTTTRGVETKLREWGESIAGDHELVVVAQDDLPVTGESVQMEVISSGEERFQVARQVQAWLERHPAVAVTWNSHSPGKDVIDLDIKHELLAARGLTVEHLIQALSIAVDGLLVDELQTLDERVRYRLQLPVEEAAELSRLGNLPIVNNAGQVVYLGGVVDFNLRPGIAGIKHYLGKRTVTVYARIDESQTSTALINAELEEFISRQDWPQRYPQLRLSDSGVFEESTKIGSELSRAALLCFLAILAALIILFNSLSQPFVIMLCLPFGLIGVVLAYSLQGLNMGAMAITGVIGLMGVLVNDSLVLMHTLNERRKGKGAFLTVEEIAGAARQRFRPIVITSITTFAGLIPTAYGIMGENSYLTPVFMSMAWGVACGGLVSLILLPVLYLVDQDLRLWFGRRVGWARSSW